MECSASCGRGDGTGRGEGGEMRVMLGLFERRWLLGSDL